MSSALRPLRWRAAVSLVGAALVIGFVVISGRTSYVIQIDYTWGRGFLDSAVVEIDGAVVGLLIPFAEGRQVTGFRVDAGEHVVRVLRDGCESVPETVTLEPAGGRLITFMADVDDDVRCRVLLR